MTIRGPVFRAWTLALLLSGAVSVRPLSAAEQNPQLEVGPPRPAQDLGITLVTSLVNSVYVPARLALTTAAAIVGGFVGLVNGGNLDAAAAIWQTADGDAFVTPSMIEQRRWPRLGPRR
ncbi:MAG: hypothetical protein KatS3mg077_1386 [Candidatus Binatia bacterium]|nr:MAG: hypothetical protein KatS3mg077_1386 [Candidatus Binatia bacterium]